MKIIGKINIGNDIIQVDEMHEEFSLKAPIGTYIFDSLQNVKEKTGKKDSDWTRSTFRVMMMNLLSWAVTMLDAEQGERKEFADMVFNSIANFKKGEPSEEGRKAVNFLKNECEMIGFCPSTTYIMHKSRGEGSLNVFWEHPFSIPTLLFKHKKLPFLILSNGNLDFDDSRLIKMNKMAKIEVDEDLEGEISFEDDEVRGITG
jgi:hypothetical protein